MIIVRTAVALAVMLSVAEASATRLWDELVATAERHIEQQGPDTDTADFIARAGDAMWRERETLFSLTAKYLDSDKPAQVSGAYEVLYRLRGHRPMNRLGDKTSFEKEHADYFGRMDRLVLGHVPQAIAMKQDHVFRTLGLYLSRPQIQGAHAALRQVVAAAPGNAQSAICLTWHQDPADMELLLPIMLGDAPVASELPYHFRNAYGNAALPYLRRAAAQARGRFTREEATKELAELERSPVQDPVLPD